MDINIKTRKPAWLHHNCLLFALCSYDAARGSGGGGRGRGRLYFWCGVDVWWC